ncbi:(R,S)-reticuline 7-O-methyltransferase [Senna tora]|uniref:(R,S)-reticuline 7-O-methyltransferase n=1 Tax=Senna tora TaxID=362788 RepID=A0A834TIX4_9FABA|nr:(R,S)-reticuline 7-O-methyltransferase [Senna tora]
MCGEAAAWHKEGLNDGRKGLDFDDVVTKESSFSKEPLPILLSPLFASSVVSKKHHIKSISCLIKDFIIPFWLKHMVHYYHLPCLLRYCLPAILQYLYAVLVAPVMQNPLHQINSSIKTSSINYKFITFRRSSNHMWQIKVDSFNMWGSNAGDDSPEETWEPKSSWCLAISIWRLWLGHRGFLLRVRIDREGLNDGRKGFDFDDVVTKESSFSKEPLPILLSPLFASCVVSKKHHIKSISCLIKDFIIPFWLKHMVHYYHLPCLLRYCLPAILQYLYAVLIAPVMQNPLHQNSISRGDGGKHVSSNMGDSIVVRRSSNHMWQIKVDSFNMWWMILQQKHGGQSHCGVSQDPFGGSG